MDFKPDILNHLDVKSFEWALPPAHEGYQLFAKFEPNKSSNLTYVLMKGRTFHNPEEPATLFLRNLKVFDENEYTLFITYVNCSGQPPEYVLNLEVEGILTYFNPPFSYSINIISVQNEDTCTLCLTYRN